MDVSIVVSLTILLVVIGAISLSAARSPPLFRLAKKFFFRKKRLTAMAVLGLIVAPAIITGSLAVGDSMKASVIEEVYGNLGGVDEVVHSDGLFNITILHSIEADTGLAPLMDATAPLLWLKGSVRNIATGLFESKADVFGYDDSITGFGRFHPLGGVAFDGHLDFGQAAINERLATNIGVGVGDVVRITTRNPEFSVESIYSLLSRPVAFTVIVVAVVKDEGLGRLDLETGGKTSGNLFVNLTHVQSAIGSPSKINTILVSNEGDERTGVALTTEVTAMLRTAMDDAVGLEEMKFSIDALDYVRFESANVFFEGKYLDVIESLASQIPDIDGVSPLTTYFVNNLSSGGHSVAYSTITGLDPQVDYAFGPFVDNATGLDIVGEITDDEMIITTYTAGRLNAGVGDAVKINYTVYDSTFSPAYMESSFTVAYVVNITGKAYDDDLMPPIPGIRGTSSCADWEPPWISGDVMRSEMVQEDLDYWATYGGTPKAYITLRAAQSLWSNEIGNMTTIKIKTSFPGAVESQIRAGLNAIITAGEAGITMSPIKKDGIESAEGVQLLTETFISFGAVIVISGIILAGSLVGMIMEGRRKEIGILKTIGAKRGQVTKILAFEAFFLALISSAVGIFVGLIVAFVCITLTNTFWSNIVEGSVVSLHFTPETLIVGYISGLLVSFLAFVIFTHRNSKMLLAESLREIEAPKRKRRNVAASISLLLLGIILTLAALIVNMDDTSLSLAGLLGPVLVIMSLPMLVKGPDKRGTASRISALFTIVYTFFFDIAFMTVSEATPFILFFLSGFVIVFASVIGLATSLKKLGALFSRALGLFGPNASTMKIAFLAPSRRVRRTCFAVTLFAIVTFTYLGLSANIQGQHNNLMELIEHQGAGYDVLAQSSISIRFDLGNADDRAKNGLTGFPNGTEVVQFLTFGQMGGSCSNLKRNLPPRLIAVNQTFSIESTLRFQSPVDGGTSAWSKLNEPQEDGSVPAIGDYNTIIWILGKDVGGRIPITDEKGEDRELVVVGIVENSIFPGSVFISEDNINRLYPMSAEYNLFLFKTDDPRGLVSYLESSMESHGMDASPVDGLVEDNLSIEWSYMSLFQALLLMGLVVGIFALVASASRSIEERRSEIATLRALGIKRGTVRNMMAIENQYIALLGILIGVVAGLLTAFAIFGRGSLTSYSYAVPLFALGIVLLVVVVMVGLATIAPAMKASRMNPVEALRREQ